jgi:hypothetical protein
VVNSGLAFKNPLWRVPCIVLAITNFCLNSTSVPLANSDTGAGLSLLAFFIPLRYIKKSSNRPLNPSRFVVIGKVLVIWKYWSVEIDLKKQVLMNLLI